MTRPRSVLKKVDPKTIESVTKAAVDIEKGIKTVLKAHGKDKKGDFRKGLKAAEEVFKKL